MTDLDPVALRVAYDTKVRAREPDPVPPGATTDRDGPLLRISGLDRGGFLTYRDLGGLDGPDLDGLIRRQREFFAARGEAVEWKLHGHDEPADLGDRLRAAGFLPEPEETVVIGPAAPLAATMPVLPEGIRLREVTHRVDLERIARMEERVWGDSRGWLADGLERELAADPDGLSVVVAETGVGAGGAGGGEVVSAGWVRYVPGTGFATLWGGSTLPAWRRQGIYKALVTHRARLADARGFVYLQVDASDDSRPVLQRLGFVAVTTTTPYVFDPNR
ncbi:GNAT family N-acetyltransferase [Rhizomonospora bruguierae]|uniref:GNAT family N-acetyltransferase n=1 Tax=Rhizomonospora bruguierae TaxID=1581705 RepID=UPI001BCE7A5E|nr:GNAT family N-acetyltransferase [Micromonospora sp. NBRC 107566]